ncbi:hypothetical protein SLE2022_187180 [Rubroshorea leprosula]
MAFRLFPIFVPLAVALVASHAALSPEAYWKTVLPNTPMPKAVRELLHPGICSPLYLWIMSVNHQNEI